MTLPVVFDDDEGSSTVTFEDRQAKLAAKIRKINCIVAVLHVFAVVISAIPFLRYYDYENNIITIYILLAKSFTLVVIVFYLRCKIN